jgi:PKD repeat protein
MRKQLFTIIFILSFQILFSTTIYVDVSYMYGNNDGSEAHPFNLIQEGVDAAVNGDLVLILPGFYQQQFDFDGKAITVGSLFVTTGDEGYIDDTWIDANFNQFWSIVDFTNGEDTDSQLIGLTIRNAKVFGGINIDHASPTLENLIIEYNNAYYYGGGINMYHSNAVITDVIVRNNCAGAWGEPEIDGKGGGINIASSDPILTNVVFENNYAYGWGGGINIDSYSNPTFVNVTVDDNYAATKTDDEFSGCGGGICMEWADIPLTGVEISNNTASRNGGGIYLKNSEATIHDISIYNNSVTHDGAAIYSWYSYQPEIENCLIYDNSCTMGASGAITFEESNGTLNHVTMYDNNIENGQYSSHGGINLIGDSDLFIDNSIIWNPNSMYEFIFDYSSNECSATINYSDICDGIDRISNYGGGSLNWQIGNISDNPLFCDSENNDFQLAINSPCLGTGNNGTNIGNFGTACGPIHFGNVWHVKTNGSDVTGVGLEEYPFQTIQKAVDESSENDTIYVYDGTFVEFIDLGVKNLVIQSISGQENTYIDGQNLNTKVIQITGGQTNLTIIDGFTIMNGNNSGNGGGIQIVNSSPVIKNCYITDNNGSNGGGISIESNSSPVLENLLISGNSSISGNGGGLYVHTSSPQFDNCSIESNSAVKGGGLFLNSTLTELGAINFYNNAASSMGGGLFIDSGSSIEISHCEFAGNSGNSGAAIYNNLSNCTAAFCTFYENTGVEGVGVYNNSVMGDFYVENCIFRNNYITNSLFFQCENNINYNCLDTSYSGEGNIVLDPQFIDPMNYDFDLQNTSPCIDAGNPDNDNDSIGWYFDVDDQDPDSTRFDMGAHYHDQPVFAFFEVTDNNGYSPLTPTISNMSIGSITSWEWDFDYDGMIDSYEEYPETTFNFIGIYSIHLRVSDGINESTYLLENICEVYNPICDFSVDTQWGFAPLTCQFNDLSDGNISLWEWDFDDDGLYDSVEQNPEYTFDSAGVYPVYLQISDGYNGDSISKENYITVIDSNSAGFCLDFEDNNGYVDVGNTGPININEFMTIEAWVNIPSDIPDETRVGNIIGCYNHFPNFNLEIHRNGKMRLWWNGGELSLYCTDFDLRDDQWHHLAVTRNSTTNTINFVIDGELRNSFSAGTDRTYNWPLRIGADFRSSNPAGIPFHGKIDEIRIWNRELSTTEINEKKNIILDPAEQTGLINYWRFNEGDFDTVEDLTGNSDGTIYDSPTRQVSEADIHFNEAPVAICSENFEVDEGDVVNLDGTASYDDDNDLLEYFWIAPPEITLIDETTATPYFAAPEVSQDTAYTITLQVYDSYEYSVIDTIIITVLDIDKPIEIVEITPPTGLIEIQEGDDIYFSIDAFDPDGNDIEYNWLLDGQNVSTTDTYEFTTNIDSEGEYILELYLTDNYEDRRTITRNDSTLSWNIIVHRMNQTPVAVAGSNRTINSGDRIKLDSNGSYDPDWLNIDHLLVGEYGQNVNLYGQDSLNSESFTRITTNLNGVNVYHNNNPFAYDIDSDGLIDVIISAESRAFKHYEQVSPDSLKVSPVSSDFSNIGSDHFSQAFFTDLDNDALLDLLIGNYNGKIKHYEQDSLFCYDFSLVSSNFNGIDVGEYACPLVHDIDGDGLLDLLVGERLGNINHYEQNQQNSLIFNHITSSFNGIDVGYVSNPSIIDIDGDGLLDLLVGEADGNLNRYEQNQPNSYSFSNITNSFCGIDVGMNSAPNFTSFEVLQYQWTISPGFDLIGADTKNPYFIAPNVEIETQVEIALRVYDGISYSPESYVYVTILANDADIVIQELTPAEGSINITETDSINFMVDCYDQDGNDVNKLWILEGVNVSTDSSYTFTTDYSSAGIYSLELHLSDRILERDGTRNDSIFTWTIDVSNNNRMPVADAGTNQSVWEDELVSLDGSGSYDPDNETLTYRWSSPSEITLSDSTAESPTFTAPLLLSDETYQFALVVNDGTVDSDSSYVDVLVQNIDHPIEVTNLSPEFSDTYSIELYDSFGDGWTGALLDLYINDEIVLENITLANGSGPETYQLIVENNDEIVTNVTPGNYFNDVSYIIKNSNDETIVSDGPAPTGITHTVSLSNAVVFINEDDSQIFTVEASDPDGYPLIYDWKLDDISVSSETSYEFITTYEGLNSSGTYIVSLDLSDGLRNNSREALHFEWNVRVNDIQVIVNELTPAEGELNIYNNQSIQFSVSAQHVNQSPLSYLWELNSSYVGNTNSYQHSYDTNLPAESSLELIISYDDGTRAYRDTSFSWTIVQIENPPIADAGDDQSVISGDFVQLDGSGSYDNYPSYSFIIAQNYSTLQEFIPASSNYSTYSQVSGSSFETIAAVTEPSIRIIDLDNDGLDDIIVGNYDGSLVHYEFTESGEISLISENFSSISVSNCSKPCFADFDYDGKLDMLIGDLYSMDIHHYEQSVINSYQFDLVTDTFLGEYLDYELSPYVYDTYNDGYLELFLGRGDGTISLYSQEYYGSNTFTLLTHNMDYIDVGESSNPVVLDLDFDDSADLFITNIAGDIYRYEDTYYNYELITDNFANLLLSGYSSITFFLDTNLTYDWSAPEEIVLSSNTIYNPTFTAPDVSETTDYLISLTVNDGIAASLPDEVTISVLPQTLDAVENLFLNISGNDLELTWDENVSATTYKVFCCDTPDGIFTEDTSGVITDNGNNTFTWSSNVERINSKFYYVKAYLEIVRINKARYRKKYSQLPYSSD